MKHNNIVSEKLGLIFYCPAKVANTSIKSVISNVLETKPRRLKKLSHGPAIIAERYRNLTGVAFVRNPYDRMVSCWKNRVAQLGLEGASFSEFIDFVVNQPLY